MGGYGSSTNELRALRKLERAVRRAFHGLDSVKAAEMAREWRGSGGSLWLSHARQRDILQTLDQLAQLRESE